VRLKGGSASQNLGFASRPFILVPIFLATLAVRQQDQTITFRSAAEMLDTFGMRQGGSQYRRLLGAFQRVFGATIFFGTDTQPDKAAAVHQVRFDFMAEVRIWYSRDPAQQSLPGDCQDMIVLSDEFYREAHGQKGEKASPEGPTPRSRSDECQQDLVSDLER